MKPYTEDDESPVVVTCRGCGEIHAEDDCPECEPEVVGGELQDLLDELTHAVMDEDEVSELNRIEAKIHRLFGSDPDQLDFTRPEKPEPFGYITRDTYEHMQEGLTGGYISRTRDRLFCVPLYAEVDDG